MSNQDGRLEVRDNDHARELIEEAGITCHNVTKEQLTLLWHHLNKRMTKSGNYKGTYAMNDGVSKFMTCHTEQWSNREAVSFNRDGFVGFAGWADSSNTRPILDAVGDWLGLRS